MLETNIRRFLINIFLFSLLLAGLASAAVYSGLLTAGIQAVIGVQFFVLLVTVTVHLFLMRSATAGIRIRKFLFNFMLATTIKMFVYGGAFVVIVILGKRLLIEPDSYLTLFFVLLGFYLLYTVFEVTAILTFLKKLK